MTRLLCAVGLHSLGRLVTVRWRGSEGRQAFRRCRRCGTLIPCEVPHADQP